MISSIPDLVHFLKTFHRHWLADHSLPPDFIPTDLPPGLATIYRELGALVEITQGPENDWRAPFATQDGFVELNRLKRVDGMIEFAWENQGNWSARCPLGQPDPPVFSDAPDVWNTERRGFVEVCGSLNHFLITLCLQEAVMSCRSLATTYNVLPPDQTLSGPVKPLWLDGWYVNGEPDHQFFVSLDQEVLVMDWAGVWIGSPTQDVRRLVKPGVKVNVLR